MAPKTRNAPPPSAPATHDLSSHPSDSQHPAPNGSSSHPSSTPEWDAARRKLLRLLPHELVLSLDDGVDPEADSIAFVSSALYKVIKRSWPAGRVSIGHCVRPNGSEVGGPGGEKDKGREDGRAKDDAGAAGPGAVVKRIDVKVREAKGVSRGHIWVGEKVRKDLGLADATVGFELLRYVSS